MSHIIIVEIKGGMLQGVYTNKLGDFEVRIKDGDIRSDNEEEYLRLSALINTGAVHYLCADSIPLAAISEPPLLNNNILLSKENAAVSEVGRLKQLELAAYTNGYLTSIAELNKHISSLSKSHDMADRKLALELDNCLQTFRNKQHDNFERLCDYLNTPERFDSVE